MSEPEPNPHVDLNNARNLPRVEDKVSWLRDRFLEGSTPHQIAVEALAQLEATPTLEAQPAKRKR